MFLSEFFQLSTCFWDVLCIDYVSMRAGLIKNGVLRWEPLARLLPPVLHCLLVTTVVGTGLLGDCSPLAGWLVWHVLNPGTFAF